MFKHHNTYFHTFFYLYIFSQNLNNITKNILPKCHNLSLTRKLNITWHVIHIDEPSINHFKSHVYTANKQLWFPAKKNKQTTLIELDWLVTKQKYKAIIKSNPDTCKSHKVNYCSIKKIRLLFNQKKRKKKKKEKIRL